MTTTLQPGAPFVCRERGGYRLWVVAENPRAYTVCGRPLASGEVIHFVVWKGDTLETRKTYTLKPGDAEWVDSGQRGLGTQDPVRGWSCDGPPIFVNRFGGKAPQWLKDAD